MSSTYHPTAGAFMPAFVPPHELAAASLHGTEPMVRLPGPSNSDRILLGPCKTSGCSAQFLHLAACFDCRLLRPRLTLLVPSWPYEPQVHSHRHKSTADRLRTAVFEQTGFMSVTTAAAFLHSGAPPQRNKP